MQEQTEQTEQPQETGGMRAMFGIWAGIIGCGLAVMIAIPLGGR